MTAIIGRIVSFLTLFFGAAIVSPSVFHIPRPSFVEAKERVIENGVRCPDCDEGCVQARIITPIWGRLGFSEIRYYCTECPAAYVVTKDDRFI